MTQPIVIYIIVYKFICNSYTMGCLPQGGGGGGVGTLIFSGIRRLGLFLGFFRKINNFLGMKILWIFLWGHHKIGLVLASFLCILGTFLRSKVQNWDILGGC